MSMNVKADNMSFGLLQRNEKLYAIGKSMEGMKPDESKKLVNGRICDPSESVFKKEIQQNVKQRKVEFSASDLTRCNNDYSDDKRLCSKWRSSGLCKVDFS